MIPQNFEYTRPKSLDEALILLAAGNAKILAGGMSLVPLMKLRLAAPDQLVDIARLPELNYIREEKDELHIGATVTHYQLESSPVVRNRCPLLAETASHIGDPQVRNRGTLGGSVAHADPAADYPAALLALEAAVVITGPNGTRTTPYTDFVVETFTTVLEPGEVIREIVVPVQPKGEGSSYQKLVHPASGFAVVGIAARIQRKNNKITQARIGVTGLGPRAYRATNVEQALVTEDPQHATAVIAQGVESNNDLYASSAYRSHLARVYALRAVTIALSRAQ